MISAQQRTLFFRLFGAAWKRYCAGTGANVSSAKEANDWRHEQIADLLNDGRSSLTEVDAVIEFEDSVQGKIRQDLAAEVGDFVLLRADGLCAYQLAVVVDDAEQGISDIVRGADLLDSTPRQIYLQQGLGLSTPRYLHLPAAVNAAGEKLSKQTRAAPVDARDPVPALAQVMQFLGQSPPEELSRESLSGFWAWALAHWDAGRIPRRICLPAP